MAEKRKRATIKERLTPCECCGYPISQRHHLLTVARCGESDATVQLCANCHEIYHIASRDFADYRNHAAKLFFAVLKEFPEGDERLGRIMKLVDRAKNLNALATVEETLAVANGRDPATARTLAKWAAIAEEEEA